MAISKVDICNMALSHLGNYGSVTDIDAPENDKELLFKTWYDNSRETLLRNTMPNFAIKRDKVSKEAVAPSFGYSYGYAYPQDCIKLLGIGNVEDKRTDFAVEAGIIYVDDDYEEGMPIRYIYNEKDVTKFTADWAELLSWYLASNVCLSITQDNQRKAYIDQILPLKMTAVSSVSAQENPPIRVSYSRFQGARFSNYPTSVNKK
jgi:hypothetical protein